MMERRPQTHRHTAWLALVALVGTAGLPAAALAQEQADVNTGKLSLEAGAEMVSEYWFRGLGQENEGLILQPYAELGINFIDGEDFTLDGYVGTWNSLHDATPGDAWFESDFYTGLTFGLPGGFEADISYINLYNPAGGDIFAEEIDLTLSYDDSELAESLGLPFGLNPYVTLAQEIDGGSDAGMNKGTYLELGIAPVVIDGEGEPFSLTVPVTVGLSIDDYYENAAGESDTFGFVDVGADIAAPFTLIPREYGDWTVTAGVHAIFLGDTAQDISEAFGTGDDDFSIYGKVGFSLSY